MGFVNRFCLAFYFACAPFLRPEGLDFGVVMFFFFCEKQHHPSKEGETKAVNKTFIIVGDLILVDRHVCPVRASAYLLLCRDRSGRVKRGPYKGAPAAVLVSIAADTGTRRCRQRPGSESRALVPRRPRLLMDALLPRLSARFLVALATSHAPRCCSRIIPGASLFDSFPLTSPTPRVIN